MKRIVLAIAVLAAFPLAASADVTKEDIKKLVAAGISEDVILAFIRSSGPVRRMSPDDLVELKQAGAGEKVLAAVAGATAPAPAPQPVQQKVYVPQTTTVVYETPTYYYSGYYPYSYPYYSSTSNCYPRYYYPSYSNCYPSYRVGFSYGYGYRGFGYRVCR